MNFYREKEVANVLHLLDKMRNEYPKEEEKYKALSIAIETIFNNSIYIMREINGDTSDGYHTFNELYHHRAVLFSVIVKAFSDKAWKSLRHHDGTMYDGMFIVGIDTPDGQATYHYDIDPYWDMFECRELVRAPEWDGHTPAQAIERIGKLEPVRRGEWICEIEPNAVTASGREVHVFRCSCCNFTWANTAMLLRYFKHCPHCGAKMDGEHNDIQRF